MASCRFNLFGLWFGISINKSQAKPKPIEGDPYPIMVGGYYTSKDDPGEIVLKVMDISSSGETIYWTLYKYGKTYYTPSTQMYMRTSRAVFFNVYEPYYSL